MEEGSAGRGRAESGSTGRGKMGRGRCEEQVVVMPEMEGKVGDDVERVEMGQRQR